MKIKAFLAIAILMLLVIAGIMLVNPVSASTGGDFELSWWTVDGGGGTSSGGDYSVSGTTGQPDAGNMSGGDYALSGGFWAGIRAAIYDLFLPLIVK